MVLDVGQIARGEQKLRRVPILTLGDGVGGVGVSGKALVPVGGGQFQAINPAFFIVEGGENERLPKQSVIELLLGGLVVAVQTRCPSRQDGLADAGVIIVGALGLDRTILETGGSAEVSMNFCKVPPLTASTGGGVK